jgi:sirohydrochlorin ferrochelatase
MMRMNSTAPTSALLLFAHGSSDPGWAEPFVRLRAAIQARDPARRVELAYLERMRPVRRIGQHPARRRVTEITVRRYFSRSAGTCAMTCRT